MNWGARYGGGWGMMGGYDATLSYVLGVMTWFLVIAVLFALLRWLWKKGDK